MKKIPKLYRSRGLFVVLFILLATGLRYDIMNNVPFDIFSLFNVLGILSCPVAIILLTKMKNEGRE